MTVVRIGRHAAGLLGVALAAWGCEPASVTDARDQLGQGPARSVELSIPVLRDSISVGDVLIDLLAVTTITIADSLLAVAVNPQTFTVTTGLTVGAISGVLDPAVLNLLNFPVEQWQEIPSSDLNLGEFESAVRDATINAALAALDVSNSADAPLTLSNFVLGVVQIDATGQPLRDMGGNLMFEQDPGGNPIVVDLEDSPGSSAFAIGRSTTKIDTVQAAALIDKLVDLILDGNRVALAGVGTAAVGDGTVGTVLATDELLLNIVPIIGFDFSVAPTGVSFDTSTVSDGLDLDAQDADDVASRLDSARVELVVSNATPFGLEVAVAVVQDSITTDVFAAPGHVELDTLTVAAATVDANGRVAQATADTTSTGLTGVEARELFSLKFTAGVRVRLLPPPGGRGAFRIGDQLVIRASASVFIRTGGAQ